MEGSINAINPSSFDEEVLVELSAMKNKISLANPERYFSFVENVLPISGSMVVGGHLLCQRQSGNTDDEWSAIIKETLITNEVLCKMLPTDELVIIGDNQINYAYRMSCQIFRERYWVFFSIPQDTYVVFINLTICMQYTYEDGLFLYEYYQVVSNEL